MVRIVAALALVCGLSGAAAQSPEPEPAPGQAATVAGPDVVAEAAARGRRLADDACAGCHATGPVGSSPLADATPFRDVVHRRSLDQLEAGFAEGLVTAHPAMPAFVFRASEIDDLIAWLETLKDAEDA